MILNAQINPGASVPVKYRRDHHLRRYLGFTETTFQHRAKTNLLFLAHLINTYAAARQTVLDPMGGSGSVLLAALTGHPVISGDVETIWCELQRDNAFRICAESLFCAPVHVARWDAGHLPLADNTIPVIITSPPYFDAFSDWNHSAGSQLSHNVGPTGDCYGFDPRQIANVHVYERYLKVMVQVYREYKRVLRPGGTLVLILGDKVHKSNVVPVTRDNETLCRANGFSIIGREERRTIPSRYRHICKQHDPDYPLIETETALVFQKAPTGEQSYSRHISIIQAPSPDNSPGQQLFHKQLYWAERQCHLILTLTGPGTPKPYHIAGQQPNPVWTGAPGNARRRREWAFEVVHQLVSLSDALAGDIVYLHISHDYAPYLERRLNTIGCHVENPTEHLNLGQKLAWFTSQTKGDL